MINLIKHMIKGILGFWLSAGGFYVIQDLTETPGTGDALGFILVFVFFGGLLWGSVAGLIAALVDRFIPGDFMKKYGGLYFGLILGLLMVLQ